MWGEIVRPDFPPRYFINAADAGLGAHVVSLVEKMKGRWPSRLVFPAAVLRGMISYRSRNITCRDGGGTWTGLSLTTVISLGMSFGDGLIIAPDGNAQDGFFRIARIGRISVFQYLMYLPALRKGRKIRHPEVTYFKTTGLHLSGDAGLEADGEDAGRLPAQIRVLPAAIRVLV
jgi:diacylglycerol kinase (ATP)